MYVVCFAAVFTVDAAAAAADDDDDDDSVLCGRRGLTACPTLESEDQLRLLNFQHNAIRVIENVDHLRRLIFLDFYDNQLEQIDGLLSLRSLRVLMLGKNR